MADDSNTDDSSTLGRESQTTRQSNSRPNTRKSTSGGEPVADDDRPSAADGGFEQSHHETSENEIQSPLSRSVQTGLVRTIALAEAVSYRWVQASFAFVFFYFGLQKWPAVQGASPVRPPVKAFVEAVGFGGWIPLQPETGLLVIGVFEVTMGTLWFLAIVEETQFGTGRVFPLAALMTIVHQTVTFLPLLVVPGVAFRQTQLVVPLLGMVPLPVALDWLSAFILKNLLFLGAFFYCVTEWAERHSFVDTGDTGAS